MFDWKTLGIECGSMFSCVPPCVNFLAGPIHVGFVARNRLSVEEESLSSADTVPMPNEEIRKVRNDFRDFLWMLQICKT